MFGAELNASYGQPLGQRWTLSPIASLSLASASIGGLRPFGEQVRFSGGQSAEAGMGLRLAGDLSAAAWTAKLAASAKVSDEFAGVNTAEVGEAPNLPITDRLGGVSTDLEARLDVARTAGGVSGFVGGAYRVNRQISEAVMTGGVQLAW